MTEELIREDTEGEETAQENAVAIVGMACRYPGAEDVEAFWRLLRDGVEAISFFKDEELEGLSEETRNHPNFVKAMGVVEDIDQFDANLFGLTPKEALLTNPAQRLFLQCAWDCLENAGYNPDTHGEALGVFAGMDDNDYCERVRHDPEARGGAGFLQGLIGNDKDYLTTRLSYLLNLRGPSVPVQTACSTSLTAIHLAAQSLLHFECDLALAGGASTPVPNKMGYMYEEGGVLSPDGRCRAFDAQAKGTSLGGGAGVVLLKRLEDALDDGDHVHAVIRGSAINNDGNAKVGFTAPSVEGQRRVIEEAMGLAEVEPRDMSMLEAHGTGTTLGDPIEIEALRQAYGGLDEPYCPIGSAKTNIGHANAAAGAAGLIKTALCLRHRTLTPSLNFESPNPETGLDRSPFYVNTETKPWDVDGPRLAGISSFGIGGTNAHAILGEAPPRQPGDASSRRCRLLTLSAKTQTALAARRDRLRTWLEANPEANLDDVAYTMNVGRRALSARDALVFEDRESLTRALASGGAATAGEDRRAVFLFPGQGAFYEDLGADLYTEEPAFREAVDSCCAILNPLLGADLAALLFAGDDASRAELKRPSRWQPALFVAEYAMARLWRSWGVEPAAMIGHSVGEYVAAALAGVFSLENALRLIAKRGQLTEDLPSGAMTAIIAEEPKIQPYLNERVSLAAVNGAKLCVLSGEPKAIDAAEAAAKRDGLRAIRLESTHAFHSHMMEPIMAPLADLAATFELNEPQIPMIANVTGTWMTAADARDPGYWARHLRGAVRFHDGLDALTEDERFLFLETGPGKVLANLAKRHEAMKTAAIASMPSPKESASRGALAALGQLWSAGLAIDWDLFYNEERRLRLPLPGYPFETQRFWLEAAPASAAAPDAGELLSRRNDPADWTYLPSWRQAPVAPVLPEPEQGERWLAFMDETGLAERVVEQLTAQGRETIRVAAGGGFEIRGESDYVIDPGSQRDYMSLIESLAESDRTPTHIIHAWSVDRADADRNLETALRHGFDSVMYLHQALASLGVKSPIALGVVANRLHRVFGETDLAPVKASLLGLNWVIPKEFSNVTCKSLDLDPADPAAAEFVIAELLGDRPEDTLALRAGARWTRTFEPLPLEPAALPSPIVAGAAYAIVHGFREIGLQLAERLVEDYDAKVALIDKSFFPAETEWDAWIQDQGEQDLVSRRIRRVRAIRERGGALAVFTAPPDNAARMAAVKADAEASLGPIRGLFHLDSHSETALIHSKSPSAISSVLAQKIREAQVAGELFDGVELTAFFGRNPAETGIGSSEQSAAYFFLDGYAAKLAANGRRAVAIDWGPDNWEEMVAEDADITPHIKKQLQEKRTLFGMTPQECLAALENALALGAPQVVVSTRDFDAVMEQQTQFTTEYFQNQIAKPGAADGSLYPRPELSVEYEPPGNEVEELISQDWRKFFGIEKVGVHDNFFELGGHSLLAVQLLAKLNDTFSTKFTLKELFDAPTVSQIAKSIAEGDVEFEDAEALDALLNEIEGLSEDDIRAALESESGAGG